MADIEDRLKSHSTAFDGLLSLIPADKYYEVDNSSQWNKRKQTKDEHKRAKKAKLDPEGRAGISAADVVKKKQEVEQRQTEDEDTPEEKSLTPVQAADEVNNMRPKKQPKKPKTQKQANGDTEKKLPTSKSNSEKKNSKKGKAGPEKEQQQLNQKPAEPACSSNDGLDGDNTDSAEKPQIILNEGSGDDSKTASKDLSTPMINGTEQPLGEAVKPSLDPVERAEQRSRLTQRIEALRVKRKADNPDGSPARNRQELMDARRKKEAARKERKKEFRERAKASEESKIPNVARETVNQTQNTRVTGPNAVKLEKTLSFGRVIFDDGQRLDHTLQGFEREKKRRGPTDVLGQLKHVEAKKRRIENMPEEKREIIEEKDKWAKALKQATGEKVRDDEKLLKKSLKRQEKTKKKSGREWKERIDTVAKAKHIKAKKREENIQARKDQKKDGKKGGKKASGKKGKPGKKAFKKGSRPGFEGRMQSGKSKS
ncbi:surfeit locus protein 6-domain-containing protein [Geopyxis carbonaria]|nr:surfeit locus protein 6-domain-containing protein [Geopyxis carbonaria]